MISIDFQNLFLGFFTIKILVELLLNRRNEIYIKKFHNDVPENFKEKISLQDHQKASEYSREKLRFSRPQIIIDSALLYFWTIGGGINLIQRISLNLSNDIYFQSVSFIIIFSAIGMIISIPFDLYSTFVIEEKFGFNKTTLKMYVQDFIKQLILSALIGIPIFLLLIYIIESYAQNWWIFAFLAITFFQFLLMWIYPTILAPIFNKFTPLQDGDLKSAINDLAYETNFKFSEIFTMDASKRSSHGNAYFTGFGKNKRIVFFDTLINSLTIEEAKAVLAHELGHFKKNHIKKMLIKSIIFSILGFYLIFVLSKSNTFFMAHGIENPNSYILLVLCSLVLPIYSFFLTPVSSYFSRKYEYEADEFAAKYTSGQDLINALIKMYQDNASTLTPDPLYTAFYFSHPSASERVRFLEKLDSIKNPE